jgi:hypothetical protein
MFYMVVIDLYCYDNTLIESKLDWVLSVIGYLLTVLGK